MKKFLSILCCAFLFTMCTSADEYAIEDYLQQYHRRDLVDLNVHGVSASKYKKDTDGKQIYKVKYTISGTDYSTGRAKREHIKKERLIKKVSSNQFEIYWGK